MKRFCKDCRHFKHEDKENGECRRRAPVVVVVSDYLEAVWPRVWSEGEGCGEFVFDVFGKIQQQSEGNK